MSISVESLTKVYGKQKAVDGISFSAQPGVLGFLGPNGAGKSTTMKILTGYIPQTSGKASVCGFDVQAQPIAVKRSIGYLPESNPLYQDMYVRESLEFIANIHGIGNAGQRMDEVIELTGLSPEKCKKIGQLSKGYKQRVGLAQAILHDPQVLILDEPTSGLDPNQLIGIRQLIRDLGKTKTVVLSTHIMQEVEAVCDHVVIINKGKIVADDTLDGLRKNNAGKSLESIFIDLTNN
jgi:ABC-2 type transport system ATP-binding protein